MSDPKQRPDYRVGNRNPLARTRGGRSIDDTPLPLESDAESEATTQANPAARPRIWARRPLLGWILALVGALGLLALLVALWATGGLRQAAPQQAAAPTRGALLSTAPAIEGSQAVLGGARTQADQAAPTTEIPGVGAAPGPPPAVAAGFKDYYDTHGGLNILGNPLSEPITVNGREIQWFERARIERWPEFAGSAYELQLGRLGAEYTAGRQFSTQQFFVSRPDMRFFAETGHALGGAFLTFWSQNGGLDVFGLPISEEFDEVLPDGKTYRVQYFERARLELHTEAAGTPYEVQAGLLGTALYRNESRPETIQPVPTAVPLP
jgi:hypothetical protein